MNRVADDEVINRTPCRERCFRSAGLNGTRDDRMRNWNMGILGEENYAVLR